MKHDNLVKPGRGVMNCKDTHTDTPERTTLNHTYRMHSKNWANTSRH